MTWFSGNFSITAPTVLDFIHRFRPPTFIFENSSRNFPASDTTKVLSALSLVAFRIS
ncbi:hypothetical protein ERS069994_02539, partial [Streptococcus pneumoniae]